jgi:probable F420-dependent oxidoreductase
MQFGLFAINLDALAADPSAAVRVAIAAEASGWESVWTGEHYVLPDPRVPPSPSRPETPMLDPFVALTNIAAHTSTLRVGTGVTVVPWHHPLVLAKQVASLDRVSGGRFLFGVGVGYLEPEFRALGVPMAARGDRMMEHLDAMRAIWTPGRAGFDGRFVQFDGVRAEPVPLQRPYPPLHFGGHVAASFERAVRHGQGWYGFALGLDATQHAVEGLRQAQGEHDRPAELGDLEISVTPDPHLPLDEATVQAFAELGVTRLIVLPPREGRTDPEETVRFVEDVGDRLVSLG